MEFIDLKAQYGELKESIHARIEQVLEHGQYIMGPEVYELEEKLAAYTGAKHCVTVASGTEALLISLMALDIKAGDEIITTPFTFIATAEVISLLGATPVFVDIEPDTCSIDAKKIESAITSRTKVIMPVSLYGQTADMDEINAIAEKYSLPVIEDAAQSLGAEYKGRKSCNLSTIGCTSFFPSKPLGCYGDGGAVFTNDDSLAKIMREIRVHGQEKRYYHTRIGVGGRMDTLQCAIVLAKLEHFPYDVARRRHLGGVYSQALDGLSGLRPIVVRPYCSSVYGQYTVITDRRERLQEALKRMGVPTAVHYPLGLHQQPALRERCIHHGLPITEAMARQVLSLPMHPHLTEEAILTIQGAMAEALRE